MNLKKYWTNPKISNLSIEDTSTVDTFDSPHNTMCLTCGKHYVRSELVAIGYICTRCGSSGRMNFMVTDAPEVLLPLQS